MCNKGLTNSNAPMSVPSPPQEIGNLGQVEWPGAAALIEGDPEIRPVIDGGAAGEQGHGQGWPSIVLQWAQERVQANNRISDRAAGGEPAVSRLDQVIVARVETSLDIGPGSAVVVRGDDAVSNITSARVKTSAAPALIQSNR